MPMLQTGFWDQAASHLWHMEVTLHGQELYTSAAVVDKGGKIGNYRVRNTAIPVACGDNKIS